MLRRLSAVHTTSHWMRANTSASNTASAALRSCRRRMMTASLAQRAAKAPRTDVEARADVLVAHRDGTLVPLLAAKKAKLEALEVIKARCDAQCTVVGDRYMYAIYLFLVLQCAVIFDWTYIHFDWTLTEPITYLVGYSATWIALWWYGNMQREFSFDNFRGYVVAKRKEKLYKENQMDIRLYNQLRLDVSALETRVRTLSAL